MAILWEEMTPENQARVQGGIAGTEIDGKIWSDVLIEIDYETKEIVWEWHVQDQLNIEDYPIGPLNNRHEWTHANTIEYLPAGNSYNGKPSVMTSYRQTDTVMIIDYESKDVVWEWGQGEIKNQHDPTLLDNGNVLIYDNGMHIPDGARSGIPHSRVVEVDPDTDEIVWEYMGGGLRGYKFFSSVISGAQRLPNGNTIICEGVPGRLFEVTKGMSRETEGPYDEIKFDNEIVWEYISPYYTPNEMGNTIFRAYRYGVNDVNWPVEMPNPRAEGTESADDDEEKDKIVDFVENLSDQERIMILTVTVIVLGGSVALNIFYFTHRKKDEK
jgi:hypothetical protein